VVLNYLGTRAHLVVAIPIRIGIELCVLEGIDMEKHPDEILRSVAWHIEYRMATCGKSRWSSEHHSLEHALAIVRGQLRMMEVA
jgi:hypothetical protein